MLFECNSLCACGPDCHRRVVQNGSDLRSAVFWEGKKGWGLKSLGDIGAGAFVASYCGELLSTTEARGRRSCYDQQGLNFLLVVRETIAMRGLVLKMMVDATSYGNETRFINHSCDPNLELHLVRVDAMIPHVCFFARRPIHAGEELTFDYAAAAPAPFTAASAATAAATASEMATELPCLCGASCCRKSLPCDRGFD